MTVYAFLEPVLYTANYGIMTQTLRLAGGGQTRDNSVLSVHAVTVTPSLSRQPEPETQA